MKIGKTGTRISSVGIEGLCEGVVGGWQSLLVGFGSGGAATQDAVCENTGADFSGVDCVSNGKVERGVSDEKICVQESYNVRVINGGVFGDFRKFVSHGRE